MLYPPPHTSSDLLFSFFLFLSFLLLLFFVLCCVVLFVFFVSPSHERRSPRGLLLKGALRLELSKHAKGIDGRSAKFCHCCFNASQAKRPQSCSGRLEYLAKWTS